MKVQNKFIKNATIILLVIFTISSTIFLVSTHEKGEMRSYEAGTNEIRISNNQLSWNLESISVTGAWELTNGSKDIIVAVIDSGVDFSLVNLQGMAWNNSAENATNGIDDDNNGFIDDHLGWDFVTSDNAPYESGSYWHGTNVANWVKEVASNVSIMDIRILDDTGGFNGSFWPEIVNAVNYSINMGADIINLSIWNYGTSPTSFHQILQRALMEGIVVVGITGNTWDDPTTTGVQYPGKFPEVIATSSISGNGLKSYFSRSGSENEICAPGGGLAPVDGRLASGTSFAAPHVSGCFALMKSINQSLSPSDVRSILTSTATDMGTPGKDNDYGYGLLNVTNAVRGAAGLPTWNLTKTTSPTTTDVSVTTTTESTETSESEVSTSDTSSSTTELQSSSTDTTSRQTPFLTLELTLIILVLLWKKRK